jgi:hypothetical protein
MFKVFHRILYLIDPHPPFDILIEIIEAVSKPSIGHKSGALRLEGRF